MGQAAGLIKEELSAKDIMESIIKEYRETIEELKVLSGIQCCGK